MNDPRPAPERVPDPTQRERLLRAAEVRAGWQRPETHAVDNPERLTAVALVETWIEDLTALGRHWRQFGRCLVRLYDLAKVCGNYEASPPVRDGIAWVAEACDINEDCLVRRLSERVPEALGPLFADHEAVVKMNLGLDAIYDGLRIVYQALQQEQKENGQRPPP
jgi:hypothetical protein